MYCIAGCAPHQLEPKSRYRSARDVKRSEDMICEMQICDIHFQYVFHNMYRSFKLIMLILFHNMSIFFPQNAFVTKTQDAFFDTFRSSARDTLCLRGHLAENLAKHQGVAAICERCAPWALRPRILGSSERTLGSSTGILEIPALKDAIFEFSRRVKGAVRPRTLGFCVTPSAFPRHFG